MDSFNALFTYSNIRYDFKLEPKYKKISSNPKQDPVKIPFSFVPEIICNLPSSLLSSSSAFQSTETTRISTKRFAVVAGYSIEIRTAHSSRVFHPVPRRAQTLSIRGIGTLGGHSRYGAEHYVERVPIPSLMEYLRCSVVMEPVLLFFFSFFFSLPFFPCSPPFLASSATQSLKRRCRPLAVMAGANYTGGRKK